MRAPDVQFADNGGASIAWSQWGTGPDILVISPLISNVEMVWEHEIYRRFLEHLGRHLRITAFDKRGMGISDRFDGALSLAERARDAIAVMDAAGLDRPALLGLSEGGLMAQVIAVEHPERVSRLLLANSFPGASRFIAAHTAPDGSFDPLVAKLQLFGRLVETFGRDPQFFVDWMAPSQADNASFVRWAGRFQRQSSTAADLQHQIDSIATLDPADRLGEIVAPTLVLHGRGDAVMPVSIGRALAAAIPGSRFVELDTEDHFLLSADCWMDIADLIIEFVTGAPPQRRHQRQFATVVLTDIVSSTQRAVAVGDTDWSSTLDSHDEIAWALADEHGGTIVKSTGDGILARFASPSDAVAFAAELRDQLAELDLTIRCGIHSGEIELRDTGDVAGIAVNLAARVEQAADDGSVLVSSTVRDLLLGGEVQLEDAGEHALKGFDTPWRLFRLVS